MKKLNLILLVLLGASLIACTRAELEFIKTEAIGECLNGMKVNRVGEPIQYDGKVCRDSIIRAIADYGQGKSLIEIENACYTGDEVEERSCLQGLKELNKIFLRRGEVFGSTRKVGGEKQIANENSINNGIKKRNKIYSAPTLKKELNGVQGKVLI